MTREKWEEWAFNHKHPAAARRVLAWLDETDPEEMVWQHREELVALVVATVKDCSDHVKRFEGVDFDMIERFDGATQ